MTINKIITKKQKTKGSNDSAQSSFLTSKTNSNTSKFKESAVKELNFNINNFLSSNVLNSIENDNSKKKADLAGITRIQNIENINNENNDARNNIDPNILIDNPSIADLAESLGLNLPNDEIESNNQNFIADNFINSDQESFQAFNNISNQISTTQEVEYESLIPRIFSISKPSFLLKNEEELQSIINELSYEAVFSKIENIYDPNFSLGKNVGKFSGLDFDISKFRNEISKFLEEIKLIKNYLENNIIIGDGEYSNYSNDLTNLRQVILSKMGYKRYRNLNDQLSNYSPNTFIADLFFEDLFSSIFQCNILGNHDSLIQFEPTELYSSAGLHFGLYSKLFIDSNNVENYSRSKHIGLPYKLLFDENCDQRNFSMLAFKSRNPEFKLINRVSLPNFLGGGGRNPNGPSSQFTIVQNTRSGSQDEVRLNTNIIASFGSSAEDIINEISKDSNLLNFMTKSFENRNYSKSNSISYVIEPAFREILRSFVDVKDFSYYNLSSQDSNSKNILSDSFNELKERSLGKFKNIALENSSQFYETEISNNSLRNSYSIRKNGKTSLLFEKKSILLDRANNISVIQRTGRPIIEEIFDSFLDDLSSNGNIDNSANSIKNNLEKISNFSNLVSDQSGLNEISNTDQVVDNNIMAAFDAAFDFLQEAPRSLQTFAGNPITYGHYYLYQYRDSLIAEDNSYANKFFKNDINSNQNLLNRKPELGLAFDLSTIDLFQRAFGVKTSNIDQDLAKAYSVACFYYCLCKLITKKSNLSNADGITRSIFSHAKERFSSKFENDPSNITEVLAPLNNRQEINKFFIFKMLKSISKLSNVPIELVNQQPEENRIGATNADSTTALSIDCDYEIFGDNNFDFLPFDSKNQFIRTIAADPAAFAFFMGRVHPITNDRNQSINLFEQTYRFCEKFIEINKMAFYDNQSDSYTSFTKFGNLGIEYFISVGVKVVAEVMKDIFTSKYISTSRVDFVNQRYSGERVTNEYKTRRVLYQRISQVNFISQINRAKNNYSALRNNIRNVLISSINNSKDLIKISKKLNQEISLSNIQISKLKNEIKSNDFYPYFNVVLNASVSGGSFNNKLIKSISSGYNHNLQNCLDYSVNSLNTLNFPPSQVLNASADFKNSLYLSICLSAWSLLNASSTSYLKSLNRQRIFSIGLPNRFLQTSEFGKIYFPINSTLNSAQQSQFSTILRSITSEDVEYKCFDLKIYQEDLRYLDKKPSSRNPGGLLTPERIIIDQQPISLIYPIDLYVKSCRFLGNSKLLESILGNQNFYQYFSYSTGNSLSRFLLNNFNFSLAKFDVATGKDIKVFDLKSAYFTPDIENLLISYAIQNFQEIKNKIPATSQTILADKRFNKQIIPSTSLEECFNAATIFQITREEITRQITTERNDYGFSYREIKNSQKIVDTNSREFFVNSFLLSFARKCKIPSGFLRSISPKAFDKMIHIPVDLLLGQTSYVKFKSGQDQYFLNRFSDSISTDLITSLRPELLEVFKRQNNAPIVSDRLLSLNENREYNDLFIGNFYVDLK
jgi:hypothetical protein